MDKEERGLLDDFPSTRVLTVLGCVVVLLFVFLVFTLLKTGRHQDNNKQYDVPEVVSDFLTAITAPGADFEDALNTYVATTVVNGDTSGEIGNIRDVLSFEYVFTIPGDSPHGYTLKDSTKGYVEFCIRDSEDQEVYPRVAFSYVLSDDGTKIEDYSIGRLQPFSRLNPEYSERWK